MMESLETLREIYRFRIEVLEGWAWEILEIEGPGTPIVFLAGGQGTAEVFFKPMLRMAGKRAMLGLHYPANPRADQIADHLALLMDRLGLDSIALVGSSFGSYVAQHFSARFPERVESMVLGNAFLAAEEVKSWPAFNKANLESCDLLAFKQERVAALRSQPESEYRTVMLDQVGARQSAESVMARMMGVAISQEAPMVRTPMDRITVIDCTDDTVIQPGMKRALVDRFADADIRVLLGGGHYPNLLNPDAYTAILEEKLLGGRNG